LHNKLKCDIIKYMSNTSSKAARFLAFNLSIQRDPEAIEEDLRYVELLEAIGGNVESFRLGIELGKKALDAIAQGQPPKHSPYFSTAAEHEVYDGFLRALDIGGLHLISAVPVVQEQGFGFELIEIFSLQEQTQRERDFKLSIPGVRVNFIPPGRLISPADLA